MRSGVRGAAAYVVFALIFGGGVSVLLARQNRSRTEARRQTCAAIVDQRRTLADVIALAIPPVRPVDPTLSPDLQRLIAQSQERTQAFLDRAQARLSRPIPFCRAAGVDTTVTVHGATPLPVVVSGSTSTTTTTSTSTTRAAPREQSSSRTTRSRREARSLATRPAGSAPTTTRPSSSTTTTRPCPVPVTLLGRCPL